VRGIESGGVRKWGEKQTDVKNAGRKLSVSQSEFELTSVLKEAENSLARYAWNQNQKNRRNVKESGKL
jgi:hypothetical protein